MLEMLRNNTPNQQTEKLRASIYVLYLRHSRVKAIKQERHACCITCEFVITISSIPRNTQWCWAAGCVDDFISCGKYKISHVIGMAYFLYVSVLQKIHVQCFIIHITKLNTNTHSIKYNSDNGITHVIYEVFVSTVCLCINIHCYRHDINIVIYMI